jgi:hypothetical protein
LPQLRDTGRRCLWLFAVLSAQHASAHSETRRQQAEVQRTRRDDLLAEAFSVPIESERRLYFFISTRFLDANRDPLGSKTL